MEIIINIIKINIIYLLKKGPLWRHYARCTDYSIMPKFFWHEYKPTRLCEHKKRSGTRGHSCQFCIMPIDHSFLASQSLFGLVTPQAARALYSINMTYVLMWPIA